MKNYEERDEFLRKRAERKRKKRRRNLIIGYFTFMVLALCVLTILTFTVFFPIKNISVTGSKVYEDKQILAVSGIEKGDNIFAINQKKVLLRLKNNLPYVEKIEFKRKLPDTLNIVITDADEYACFNVGGSFYTVSKSGWVLEKSSSKPDNIFEIRGVKVSCKVGSQIEYKNAQEKELVDRLLNIFGSNNVKPDFVDVTDALDIKIGAEKRFEIDLGSPNHLEEKIKHFSKMIQKIPEKEEGYINLSMWSPENTTATFVKKTEENIE